MNKAHDFHGKVGIKFTVSFMVISDLCIYMFREGRFKTFAELSEKFF